MSLGICICVHRVNASNQRWPGGIVAARQAVDDGFKSRWFIFSDIFVKIIDQQLRSCNTERDNMKKYLSLHVHLSAIIPFIHIKNNLSALDCLT